MPLPFLKKKISTAFVKALIEAGEKMKIKEILEWKRGPCPNVWVTSSPAKCQNSQEIHSFPDLSTVNGDAQVYSRWWPTETLGLPKLQEKETAECPVLRATYAALQALKPRDSSRRGARESVKARSEGWLQGNSVFKDTAGQPHRWAQSSCDCTHKTRVSPWQTKPQHGVGSWHKGAIGKW